MTKYKSPGAFLVASALMMLAGSWPRPARAQELTPPRIATFVPAERPDDAPAEGAAVELQLTVAADGTVGGVEVVASAGQALDDAAVTAVRQFVFEPARRDGSPIAARIRYRYVFEPLPSATSATAATSAVPAPPTNPGAPPARRTGRIEGRIRTRKPDQPLPGALVTLTTPGAETPLASTLTDEQGTFRFVDLAPGAYVVHVRSDGATPVDQPESVTPGEATVITYRLEASSRDSGESYAFGATASIAAPPRETTKRTLAPEELTAAAGTRGDPLRVIELLPGVARPPALTGFLIIRGAGPDDSQVMFEGGPIDHLYHFGGLTSVANGRLLDHIDLYPGNFSVRYGRKIGGIVDVGLRDPRSDGYHALVDVNLIDATVMAEGPVGQRGAFVVSARRSYIDFWFRDVVPQEFVGITAAPVYDDYQAMYSYRSESGGRLRVLAFGSSDVFKLTLKQPADGDPAVQGGFGQENDFRRLQVSWRQMLGRAVEEEITLGVGTLTIQNQIAAYALNVDGVDGLLRAEWRAPVGPWVKLIGGFDGYLLTGNVTYDGPVIQQQDGDPGYAQGPLTGQPIAAFRGRFTSVRPAAYAEALVQAGQRWLLVPGLRADYFSEISAWSVSPRLTARWKVAPETVLKGGAGLFSQPPQYGETLAGLGNPHLGLTYAQQYSVGAERGLGARASVGVDTFYKRLSDVEVNGVDGSGQVTQVNGGRGRIYGLEVSAKLEPVGRTFGFLSYTLSRSERNDGQGWRLFDYDQTHILTVAGGVRLRRSWELSATFRLTSGNPATPVVGSVYDANSDYYVPTYGAVNSVRDPLFHQLSVRAEKTWIFRAWRLAAYLDVQNAYNHRSQEGLQYSYDYAQSQPVQGLPILPSFGLRGEI